MDERIKTRVRGLVKKVYKSGMSKTPPSQEEPFILPPKHTKIILNSIEFPAAGALVLAYLSATGYVIYSTLSRVPALTNQAYVLTNDFYQQVSPYVEKIESFLS